MTTLFVLPCPDPRTVLRRLDWRACAVALLALMSMLIIEGAVAATTTGAALKPAFDTLNDIANGYGKQLLVLVGFVSAAFALLAVNAAAGILRFIGYVIFLAVALGAGLTLSGALI